MRLKLLGLPAAALALVACERGVDDADKAGTTDDMVTNESLPLGNAAAPASPAAPPIAENGQQYVDLAGAGDLYEIEAARLALERTENADVRELAQMVLADHQRSAEQLASAARRARPPLNMAPRLSPAHENDLQALRAAAGTAFDREYLQQQMRAHEGALGLVTHYAVNGEVDELRRHATAASDSVRRHLSRARDLLIQVL